MTVTLDEMYSFYITLIPAILQSSWTKAPDYLVVMVSFISDPLLVWQCWIGGPISRNRSALSPKIASFPLITRESGAFWLKQLVIPIVVHPALLQIRLAPTESWWSGQFRVVKTRMQLSRAIFMVWEHRALLDGITFRGTIAHQFWGRISPDHEIGSSSAIWGCTWLNRLVVGFMTERSFFDHLSGSRCCIRGGWLSGFFKSYPSLCRLLFSSRFVCFSAYDFCMFSWGLSSSNHFERYSRASPCF